MNAVLQGIYKISILVPIGFYASQVVGMEPQVPVQVAQPSAITALGSPKDIFIPQPNNPPLFTRGSGTR
jgi:hypothetical protein